MDSQAFLQVAQRIYGDSAWPPPLHLVRGATRVRGGEDEPKVRADLATSRRTLANVLAAPDSLAYVLAVPPDVDPTDSLRRARRTLGQLLLGRCAELVFEDLYRTEMQSQQLDVTDERESRSDTDYRIKDSSGRPLYRINIKFHGARFRRAPELVGIDPLDCFALATYKIHSALQKQNEEHLPYFFAVVGVANLTGAAVGEGIPDSLAEATSLVYRSPRFAGKRSFEDRVVDALVASRDQVFQRTYDQIKNAEWYILSARKADMLLRDKLFERVFALRIRGFAQQFRAAELDMHFSLSQDLTPLKTFFATLREEGLTKVATQLERGII